MAKSKDGNQSQEHNECSSSNFHQGEPRPREVGEGAGSKDALEKHRLRQRKECHCRFDPPIHPLSQLPDLNPACSTSSLLAHGDAAQTLRCDQTKAAERYTGKLIHRRTVNLRREHEHRCRVDETFERQEQRAGSLQTRLLSLRNRGGESFDIINLNYDNTDAGRALQEKDEAAKARAAERTGRFYAHSHSVKHDIITGEDLKLPCSVPQKYRVLAPWEKPGERWPS